MTSLLIVSCLLVVAYTATVGYFLWLLRDQATSHRQEVAQLNQARMEETADLLQRIQAPETAVAAHAGQDALPDPPPVNLENDDELFQIYKNRVSEFVDG